MKTLPLTRNDFKWINLKKEEIETLVSKYLENKKKVYTQIKKIKKEDRSYLNTIYALERADDKEDNILSKIGFLTEVSTDKDLRDKGTEILSSYSSKFVDVEYDKEMFDAIISYYEGNYKKEKNNLRKEDIKLTEDTVREYKRMGFSLPLPKMSKLKSLMKKSSKLSIDFRKNINDYQDYIICSREELDGLTSNYINSLPKDNKGNYLVSLQYPHFYPYMTMAKNRSKRKELAEKNLKKGGIKNLKIINELISIRHEMSSILGYKTYADFKTENRMAKNGKNVEDFINPLINKLKPKALSDIKVLKDFALKEYNQKSVEYYDINYLAESYKKKFYDIDREKIREFFPTDHVIKEMFSLFENLFSISIKEKKMTLWNKDALFFEVTDNIKGNASEIIGYIALDLYPREGKYGHACANDIISAKEESYKSESYLPPFSSMLCNFPKKIGKVPSMISIGDVETLFHEFGHLLHMTLTRANLESQSGANVAWDFVETPSQFMENFVWNKVMLKKLSKHYKTGKSLDDKTIEKLLKVRKFMSGYNNLRQLSMALLDLKLHTGKIKDGEKEYIRMHKEYFGLNIPKVKPLFMSGFGHLVGYDAGYYSYMWALVYSYDAYSMFENSGNKKPTQNKEIGLRWRKEVLEKGSSIEEIEMIKNFLGRKPSNKAFLEEVL